MLSLLVMFSMVTVTFMLVAGQYKRMSRIAGKVETVGNDPRKQLDEAFGQLTRGTLNPQSSLFKHDLLGDLYGHDGVKIVNGANIAAANPTLGAGGPDILQLIDLRFNGTPNTVVQRMPGLPSFVSETDGAFMQLESPGHFNGCVLTFLDGDLKDQSARIVGWGCIPNAPPNDATPPLFVARIVAVNGMTPAAITTNPTTKILINGRPFNGTGFGLNPTPAATANTLLDVQNPALSMMYEALMPNPRNFPWKTTDPGYNPNYPNFGGLGGPDEDYDAADPQNMALAYVPLDVASGAVPAVNILPSFHRQDLLSYVGGSNDIKRRAMLRPAQFDHPGFTGSNPTFNATNGPWDVDNDGDGVAESVWVDIGLPVQAGPDGRRYKPLVAYHCVDLDGRLNVNAHGTWAHSLQQYDTTNSGTALTTTGNNKINNYLFNATGAVSPLSLPRGMGVGPAEIDLSWLWGSDTTRLQGYRQFLMGAVAPNQTVYEGRYGEWIDPTTTGALPGRARLAPAQRGPDDFLALIRRYDLPLAGGFYYYYGTIPTNYGSPCDLWGRAMVGVDYAGQPIWSFIVDPNSGPPDVLGTSDIEFPSDPYTLNLSRKRIRGANDTVPTVDDNIFTPAELERVLRRYDLDASILPDRLRYLLDPTGTNPKPYAHLVTTDSFDLPTPAVAPTWDMVLGKDNVADSGIGTDDGIAAKLSFATATNHFPPPLTMVDLLKYRMQQNVPPVSATAAMIADLLPPEVIAGQKFDLNRPFGNGRDDNTVAAQPGYGVVDEPGETEPTLFWNNTNLAAVPGGFTTTVPDYSNGTDVDKNLPAGDATDSLMARQLYARYLYVMMCLLMDMEYTAYTEPPLNIPGNPQIREQNARRIAQWAINVVDYRDPDSIMTPFEYDVNPFNNTTGGGWEVDGVLNSFDDTASDRRVVWGAEQPAVLLTETLALHDRRVRDSLTDDGSPANDRQNTNNDMNGPDTDLDQNGVPQGSVFFELYSTQNGNPSTRTTTNSADIFDRATGFLDLGKMAPQPPGSPPYPVWRIAITGSRAVGGTPKPNDTNARVGVGGRPDTTNFDPVGAPTDNNPRSVFHPLSTNPGPVTIERIVWFSSQDPSSNPFASIIYYNKANMPTLLQPGRFALVGPRPDTYIGKNTANYNTQATQRISLSPTPGIFNGLGQEFYTTNSLPLPLPIVCSSASLPTVPGWTANHTPPNHNIGVSITEPVFSAAAVGATYYPAPLNLYPQLTYPTPIDKPLDSDLAFGAPLSVDRAAGLTTILQTGTTQNYKTALLQRLANPLQPYHQITNPYITVDWQPIDLTVFNGEERNGPPPSGNPFDPDDPTWTNTLPNPFGGTANPLVNRQRGSNTPAQANVWQAYPQYTPGTPVPQTGGSDVFDYNIPHTLGFLNSSLGAPWTAPIAPIYSGVPTPSPTQKTFPWLTWNNRPFTNAMELLLVPPYSAERLLRDFGTAPTVAFDVYAGAQSSFQLPFKHLSNFFQSSDGRFNPAMPASPYLYRILDYVGVPSPFVGTDTVFRPDKFGGAAPLTPMPISSPYGLSEQDLACYLHPPFSRVSNYREPGKVNINTIAGAAGSLASPSDYAIWMAILNGSRDVADNPQPGWDALFRSRRGGKPGNVSDPISTAPRFASVFANPFRSAAGAAYRLPGTLPTATADPEINVTMLRPDSTETTRPFFSPSRAMGTLPPYVDPDQHAYFRYQDLMRLSNSLTTRSNVYAVWITVGYFEVAPAPSGASGVDYSIYPDGWQLGAELGSDTGDIQRHRAFYIFDRSIPVGYEPGKDHNIDEATLVKRYIE